MRLEGEAVTVRHPVPDEILLDYVAGSASPGKALLVATHLAMWAPSQARHAMLAEVGGALLETLQGVRLERASAQAVLALDDRPPAGRERAASGPATMAEPQASVALCGTVLPSPLAAGGAEAADRRAWRTLGRGVAAALLSCSTPRGRTQFLRARAGAKIFPHTHEGEELVLVLKGAFWDEGERFGPGDVAVNDGSRVHAPVIDEAEECLCLAVTEGRIRFVGPAGWFLNRVSRF